MAKKIFLIFILFLSFIYVQNKTFASDSFNQTEYENYMKKEISTKWLIPLDSSNKSAVVSFVVSKTGELSNISILRSSNDTAFDESVLKIFSKIQKFKALPEATTLNVKLFIAPVLISLNAEKQGNDAGIINVSNINNIDDLSSYKANLAKQLSENWNPRTLKKQRDAVFLISLQHDGTIKNIIPQKSSNKKKFDNEIIDTILRTAPLDPLPDQIQAEQRNMQITFKYKKDFRKKPDKQVNVNMLYQDDLDQYIKNVQNIVYKNLNSNHSYFCKKDFVVTMNIDKLGNLKYVTLKYPGTKDGFIRKECKRKTLLTLYKTSYPPIPDKLGVDNINVDVRVITQRGRLFKDLWVHYLFNGFRTHLKPYCVYPSENI